MTPSLERRIAALERSEAPSGVMLIVRRIVDPADPERLPDGIEAVPPHLPAMTREPGEGWASFLTRVESCIGECGRPVVLRAAGSDAYVV